MNAHTKAAEMSEIEIVTPQEQTSLKIEVMKTPQAREQGLMFRKFLADNNGMLFEFEENEPVYMWMKNTYIPLDMIFIDVHGIIVNIANNTEPLSETVIPSRGKVKAVLEVNAGFAVKHKIHVGDKILSPFFEY